MSVVSHYALLLILLSHKSLFHHLDNVLHTTYLLLTWHTNKRRLQPPRQIKVLVPKRGAASVTWTWLGLVSLTQTRKRLCKWCYRLVPTRNASNSFYQLHKNQIKLKGDNLCMRATNVQLCDQNKPQTQTLQKTFARSTPYGPKKFMKMEKDNGCCCNYHLGTWTQFTQLRKGWVGANARHVSLSGYEITSVGTWDFGHITQA